MPCRGFVFAAYDMMMIPPKRFDISPRLTGGYSEGLDAFRFYLNTNNGLIRIELTTSALAGVCAGYLLDHTGDEGLFIARRIQPSLSLVDREVEFCVPTT